MDDDVYILLVGANRNRIEANLKNPADGNPITGASVGFTILDRNNQPVTGGSWPVQMTEEASGLYVGFAMATVDIIHEAAYRIQVSSASPEIETLTPAIGWERTRVYPTQEELRRRARAAGII